MARAGKPLQQSPRIMAFGHKLKGAGHVAKSSQTWLFLDSHEEAGVPTIWFWRDLGTDEFSQKFSSEEAAYEALRKGEVAFSPPKN